MLGRHTAVCEAGNSVRKYGLTALLDASARPGAGRPGRLSSSFKAGCGYGGCRRGSTPGCKEHPIILSSVRSRNCFSGSEMRFASPSFAGWTSMC